MAAVIRNCLGSPVWTEDAGKLVCTWNKRLTWGFSDTPSGPAALTALGTAGFTAGSACPGAAALYLITREVKPDRESKRIWDVKLVYKSFEADPARRAVNDEVIERDNSCDSHLEYYDTAFAPLDNGNGNYGVMVPSPKSIIRVKRIHTSTREAAWGAIGGHLNSNQPVTTPGGVTLSTQVGQLLFLAAPERQLDNGNIEVVYTFSKDLASFNSSSATALLCHREPIAAYDAQGRLTSVTARDVIPTASFASLMADE